VYAAPALLSIQQFWCRDHLDHRAWPRVSHRHVVNSVVSNNGTGLLANGGSFTVNLSEVDENITGLNVLGIGGTVSTYGNNSIDGNTLNNLAFLITIVLH
jgi:hypothetical protein